MSPRRNPDASRLIEWTGERCVPWAKDAAIVYEHFHRYLWAARLVPERRVLDLGSGEGFGAAILAEAAAEVTGVDIDELAVEHATVNYGRSGLRFEQASALDLSRFSRGAFDAVVAFEMIEHVQDHERLLAEVTRVLAEDGILIVSTPDKDLYSQAAGQVNPFHEHELTRAEFAELLGSRFGHVAMWGQRTITGSLLSGLGDADVGDEAAAADFFVSSEQGEWQVSGDPAPLFCVALASRRPLPAVARSSTLADPSLELLHETERAAEKAVAERDRLLGEANRSLDDKRQEILSVGARLGAVESELLARGDELWGVRLELDAKQLELEEAQRFVRRQEESVSWQLFQRAKARLYGVIGEDSRLGRGLGSLLRLLGRALPDRSRRPPGA